MRSGQPKLIRISNAEVAREAGVEHYAMPCASNGTLELFGMQHGGFTGLHCFCQNISPHIDLQHLICHGQHRSHGPQSQYRMARVRTSCGSHDCRADVGIGAKATPSMGGNS